MSLFKWSQTASANGTADASCQFPEGMSPAALNDGARGMMAAIAKYRDDVSGQLVTAGTSTAYTLASFQGFNTLAAMSGKVVYFTPHATNGANGTSLNVDGLGVKPILTAPGKGLPGGVLIAGTPYGVVYNNTDSAFYVQGLFGNPYNIPLAGGMDYWGTTLPNSNFAFPIGQAISRVTYADLFAIMGTAHGGGDGSTTFNLPDKRERVSVMIAAAASRLTVAGSGVDSTVMGANGGAEKQTLAADQVPTLNSSGSNAISVTTAVPVQTSNAGPLAQIGGSQTLAPGLNIVTSTGNNNIAVSYTNNSQKAVKTLPPLIVCNYMIRII